MTYALELERVTKRYAGHLAVDEMTLSIPAGTIYGILGPNGAGKSTTIRLAMGIIGRDDGDVRVLGKDPAADRSVLRRVGYLPEERGLYRKMRVLDVIEFFGRLKGMSKRDARAEGEVWLGRLGLGDWRRSRVEQLSKGMQQKVQFITTVLHSPELLILDEPASGLDPVNQEVLRETILSARAEGRTVVLSTHNMSEAEALCEAVCIIAEGRKVLEGGVREIRRSDPRNVWLVEYDVPPAEARAVLGSLAPAERIAERDGGWEIELGTGEPAGPLIAALARLDVAPTRIQRVEHSLHEVFVRQVGAAAERPTHRA